jgi:hypothetical protein
MKRIILLTLICFAEFHLFALEEKKAIGLQEEIVANVQEQKKAIKKNFSEIKKLILQLGSVDISF